MYLVTVEWAGPKTVTHEFKGRSAARLSRECYDSYLRQTATVSAIMSIEWWHEDKRLKIDERVMIWERPDGA